jgi:hypothetical protein
MEIRDAAIARAKPQKADDVNLETPALEELMGRIPAGFAFGAVPLGAIAAQHGDLLKEIESYDPLRLAACFGGLLTEPQLQSNCARLEILVHLCLSYARGTRKPTDAIVSRLFDALGDGMAGRIEDPAEDLFVSLIVSPRGNFRMLEGIWESAGYHTQRFIDALELIPAEVSWAGELRDHVHELLKLSDLVCARARLTRYQPGNTTPVDAIPRKVISRLSALRRNIRFTRAELVENGISVDSLAAFGFNPANRTDLRSQGLGHSPLERDPILYRNDEFYLLLPTAVSSALRRFVLEYMNTPKLRELFATTLAYDLAKKVSDTRLLGDRTGAPLDFKRTENALVGAVMTTADRGRFINVVFYADTIEDFEQDGGLVGLYPNKSREGLQKEIQKCVDYASKTARETVGFREGVTLVVGCGVRRAMADLRPERIPENWRVEGIGARDFFTLCHTPGFKPLSLFRLLEGQDRVEEAGVSLINVNGLLNLVGWARNLGGNLVPHDSLPPEFGAGGGPAMLLMEQNALLSVRAEVAKNRDTHAILSIDNQWVPVVKDVKSLFKEDDSFPFYVGVSDSWPIGVYESERRSWWIRLKVPDQAPVDWEYQRYEMLRTWLCRTAPVLDESFPDLPDGPVLINATFAGDVRDRKPDRDFEFLTVKQTLPFIEVSVAGATISLTAQAGFELAIFNPVNVAERALVTRLVEGAAHLAGTTLNETSREEIVDRIVTGPQARQSHAFNAREFRDFVKESVWNAPVKVDDDDIALVKLGLGWRTRNRAEGSEITGREACTAYLNRVVRGIEDEICADLRQFDRRSVLMFALLNHETAQSERENWRRTAPAILALRKDTAAALDTISDHDSDMNAIFKATRLMIEFAICECPLEGGIKPGHLDMSRVMAKILMTTTLGDWSDSIHWKAMEPTLRITGLGDIQANQTFNEQVVYPYARVASDLVVEENTKNYAKFMEEAPVTATADAKIPAEFASAFEEQFGFEIDVVRKFVDALEDVAIKKKRAVLAVKRSEILTLLSDKFPDSTAALKIIELFSFRPRPSWRTVPEGFTDKDLFPWRFRRRLSMLRRPLVQVDESDDPVLLIAPGIVHDAFAYMFRNFYTGDFPRWQMTPKMARWAGAERNRMGRKFGEEVAARLKELGWETEVEVSVKKMLGRLGKDYGDIDVLAWRMDGQPRVLLIECKDVQHKKTQGEVAEQLLDFRGELTPDGKRDHLLRHLDRIQIISEHVPEVMKYLKLETPPKLEGHLVFKNPVPMKFAWEQMRERIALGLFSELDRI